MRNIRIIKSIVKEYGTEWVINRILYSMKLKILNMIPRTEKLFEKKTIYPKRLDVFQIDIKKLRAFLRELNNEDKVFLIETADKACDGIIRGFSSLDLEYGNPIDWQLNPLTGKRCESTRKWYYIPDFDSERGDIKVIWEASRFSHFITLARAYLLTGNNKYYKAFSEQLHSWLLNNAYGLGANFKCGQECSLRMINALLSFTVFNRAGITTDADADNVKELIDRCYRKILSNFFYAYKCIKNNHTISELMGMIVGAWCCDDNKRLDKAFCLLDKVINEQFTDDGGYNQLSFNYQRLALQDMECVLSIESRTERHLSENSKEKIRKAAVLMYQCQDESGDMPNYGSNDGALIFPVTSCGYRNFKPVINTIYALITGKQLYEEGKHQEELIWFSAGKALEGYKRQVLERRSSQFPEAGLFTLRQKKAWAMIVLNEYKSRPAHMDQLHFDLWIDGINVLCDAGTYSYASDAGKRLVTNESHNTVVVKGKKQMNVRSPFMIYDWTKRRLENGEDTLFEGTMTSANDYVHTRRVKSTDVSYEIIDRVDEDYEIRFHTPCNVSFKDGAAVLSYGEKIFCKIKSSGKITVQMSERSLYYLRKEKITCLIIRGNKEITTFINIYK